MGNNNNNEDAIFTEIENDNNVSMFLNIHNNSVNTGYEWSRVLTNPDNDTFLTSNSNLGLGVTNKNTHTDVVTNIGTDISATRFITDNVSISAHAGVNGNYRHSFDKNPDKYDIDTVFDLSGKPHLAYVNQTNYQKENVQNSFSADFITGTKATLRSGDANFWSAGVDYKKELFGGKGKSIAPQVNYTHVVDLGSNAVTVGAFTGYNVPLKGSRSNNPTYGRGIYGGFSVGLTF